MRPRWTAYRIMKDELRSIEDPTRIEKILVGSSLYGRLLRITEGHLPSVGLPYYANNVLVWVFNNIYVHIALDESILGYKILYKQPQTKETDDMTITNLVNIRINGVLFEGLTGRLVEENLVVKHTEHHRRQSPTLELMVDNQSDTALIMYGFMQAISSLEVRGHFNGSVPLAIEGVGVDSYWVTYKGSFVVNSWKTAGATMNRVENVGLLSCGNEITVSVDEGKKPKVQVVLSEIETALIIASLVKMKQGDLRDNEQLAVISKTIKHLQKVSVFEGHAPARDGDLTDVTGTFGDYPGAPVR